MLMIIPAIMVQYKKQTVKSNEFYKTINEEMDNRTEDTEWSEIVFKA